jgi:hypothetical protein
MQSKTPDQEWEIDLDLRTRSDIPLRLVYSTNIECENRGIVVDAVSAFIGPTKVGYLKVELFPEASLQRFFSLRCAQLHVTFFGAHGSPLQTRIGRHQNG